MSIAKRGFGSMSEEERKRIARLGGLASRGGGRKPKNRSEAKQEENEQPAQLT